MGTADRLSRIVGSIESGSLRKVGSAELRELPSLYRRLVSEVAEGRARGLPREQLAGLEALVVRTHAVLYAPLPVRLGRALIELLRAFPDAVRRSARYALLAAALLLAGGAWGFLEIRREPSSAVVLLGAAGQDNAEESFQEDARVRDGAPVYGVFYFTHNARIALEGFALGATFGIGTVLLLISNGLAIGATMAVATSVGSPQAFFSFVLPHGGVELTAIVIAAAGGLRIADGLLRPGWLPRRESLVLAAREALPLALGAAALLSVAGLVEGWISPLSLPIAAKAAIGGTLNLLLVAYLLGGRRKAASDYGA